MCCTADSAQNQNCTEFLALRKRRKVFPILYLLHSLYYGQDTKWFYDSNHWSTLVFALFNFQGVLLKSGAEFKKKKIYINTVFFQFCVPLATIRPPTPWEQSLLQSFSAPASSPTLTRKQWKLCRTRCFHPTSYFGWAIQECKYCSPGDDYYESRSKKTTAWEKRRGSLDILEES